MYRTLIRIEKITDNGIIYLKIPGWDNSKSIPYNVFGLPNKIRNEMYPGYRCHAMVNLEAERGIDLVFSDWESGS